MLLIQIPEQMKMSRVFLGSSFPNRPLILTLVLQAELFSWPYITVYVYPQVRTAIRSMATGCCWYGSMGQSWKKLALLKNFTRGSLPQGTVKLQVLRVKQINWGIYEHVVLVFDKKNCLPDNIRMEGNRSGSRTCSVSWEGTLQHMDWEKKPLCLQNVKNSTVKVIRN